MVTVNPYLVNPYNMQDDEEKRLMRELEMQRQMAEKYAGGILPPMPQQNPYAVKPPMAPPQQPMQKPQINSGIQPQGMPQPDPSMAGFYGSSMAPEAQTPAPTEQPSGLMGLLGKANQFLGDNSSILNRLGAGYFALHQDPNLQKFGMQQIGEIRQADASNKTLEFLKAKGVDDATLKALAGNPQMIGAYAASLLKEPKNAQSGIGKVLADYESGAFGKVGSAEAMALRDRALAAAESAGKSETNVTIGGENYRTEVNKDLAEEMTLLVKQGTAARRNMQEITALESTLSNAPQGGVGAFVKFASDLGIKLEGASDIEAATAIINRLVPAQRPAGSGPMSDADLALFKQSLPRIINTPEGNAMIISTLKNMATYDMQMAEIANKARFDPRYTPEMAYADMSKLANPLEWVRTGFGGKGDQKPKDIPEMPTFFTPEAWDLLTDDQKRKFAL